MGSVDEVLMTVFLPTSPIGRASLCHSFLPYVILFLSLISGFLFLPSASFGYSHECQWPHYDVICWPDICWRVILLQWVYLSIITYSINVAINLLINFIRSDTVTQLSKLVYCQAAVTTIFSYCTVMIQIQFMQLLFPINKQAATLHKARESTHELEKCLSSKAVLQTFIS